MAQTKRAVRFLYEGLGGTCFRLWSPCGLGHNRSTLLLGNERCHRPLVNRCPSETPFTKVGGGLQSAEPWSHGWRPLPSRPHGRSSTRGTPSLWLEPPSLFLCVVSPALGVFTRIIYYAERPPFFLFLSSEHPANPAASFLSPPGFLRGAQA